MLTGRMRRRRNNLFVISASGGTGPTSPPSSRPSPKGSRPFGPTLCNASGPGPSRQSREVSGSSTEGAMRSSMSFPGGGRARMAGAWARCSRIGT